MLTKSFRLWAARIVAAIVMPGAASVAVAQTSTTLQATAVVRADAPGPVINRNIYGHFAEHLGNCIYGGLWVGRDSSIPNTKGLRNDVVAALKELNIPVLRWPGGCFADEYHWKDGIGPSEKRPSMINTHWGGVVENNHFGTHEFFDLVELLGCEAYVNGNVGSGTVQEMMEWVEYMTSDADSPMANLRRANGRKDPWKVQHFGVGNESWGCGGNMRPEYYADLYRRYNTFVKNYSGQKVGRIACGASADDYAWTEVLMERAGKQMDGLSLHYYTLPTGSWRGSKGLAVGFGEDMWQATLWRTLHMEELVSRHSAIMNKYDPEKKVGMVVDEWGTWYDVEPGTNPGFLRQQNSLRDALVAAINFNIFHRHADRITMANIAQMVNVLQSVILTDKEKMVLTPTYHVFEMYKVHQGATVIPVDVKTPVYGTFDMPVPVVHATASRNAKGTVHVSLVNTDPNNPATLTCTLKGAPAGVGAGRIITATTMDAHNTFAAPDVVKTVAFTGFKREGDTLTVTLPAKSVVTIALQ